MWIFTYLVVGDMIPKAVRKTVRKTVSKMGCVLKPRSII